MPGADPVYGRLPYWDDPAGYRVEDGMASEDDLCNVPSQEFCSRHWQVMRQR